MTKSRPKKQPARRTTFRLDPRPLEQLEDHNLARVRGGAYLEGGAPPGNLPGPPKRE